MALNRPRRGVEAEPHASAGHHPAAARQRVGADVEAAVAQGRQDDRGPVLDGHDVPVGDRVHQRQPLDDRRGVADVQVAEARPDEGVAEKDYEEAEQPGRYGPPVMVATSRRQLIGADDIDLRSICTSQVERNNLTMRTFIRRFTRLTLGFSKKLANLKAAVALHVAHYNFCRIHGALGMTPAMAAGVVNDFWTLDDLLAAM